MKVVDTPTLKRLASRARTLGFNRLLDKSVEHELDPSGKHILSRAFIHGDVQNIRCGLVLLKLKNREEAVEGSLDFRIDDYNLLPEYEKEPA